MADSNSLFDEDLQLVDNCVDIIQQWMTTVQKLNGKTDKEFILRFLRNAKFDIPKTQDRILRYYTYRKDYPEWLQNRDPSDEKLQAMMKLGGMLSMDKHRANNCLVVIVRAADLDADLIIVDDFIKLILLYVDLYNLDKVTQIAGVICILDFQGFGVKHLTLCTPNRLQKLIWCGLQGMPVKIKAMHLINVPILCQGLISIVKLFLAEKLRKRVFIYGSNYLDALHLNISVDCLPLEYGGTAGPFKHYNTITNEYVMGLRNYIIDDDKFGFET